MSRNGRFVVTVAVVWCVVSTAYFARRTSILQFLTIPVAVCFLVASIMSVVCVFTEWPQRRWRSLLPFVACALSVVVSSALVRTIRPAIFDWALPSYEAVVHQMESGTIPVTTELSRIPQAELEARLVFAVLAQKETNGALTVEFLTEGGLPLKHSGYLFCSSGSIEPGSLADSRWPIRRELRHRWFYISD